MNATRLIDRSRAASARPRRATAFLALALAASALAAPATALAQATIGTPSASGDQLIFFYDARSGRVPFLSVSNPSDETVDIEVAFYPADLADRIGSATFTLQPAGNVVIDPTSNSVAGGAVNGNAGLAVVTPVTPGTTQAIVPPVPLTGGFTLANTALASAFGENALGRLAVNGQGARAAAGAQVNGSQVKYQRFAPAVLNVPVHFNPQGLGPADQDGNRVILAAFSDEYGAQFDVAPATDNAPIVFFDADGFEVASGTAAIAGVLLSDLQALAGGATLDKSGKVFVDVNPGSGNAFGIFSQSLGTFASGQRMPEVATVPVGRGPRPTGTPGPNPTPTPGGNQTSATCTGGTVSLTIITTWDPTSGSIGGVTTDVTYPGNVSIPGFGSEQTVTDRVTNLTGVTNGIFQVGDTDTSINVGLVSLQTAIPAGNLARVRFDCSNGETISTGAFGCVVAVSDQLGLEVPGTCSFTIAAP